MLKQISKEYQATELQEQEEFESVDLSKLSEEEEAKSANDFQSFADEPTYNGSG